MKSDSELKGWSEEDHFEFYESLKDLEAPERSRALIEKSKSLLQKAGNNDLDPVKAAESLMTYWILNNNVEADKGDAYALLYQIYMRMDQPERAKAFIR